MADLCLRQGHRDDAVAIYRRLLSRTVDPSVRDRINKRIASVAGTTAMATVARSATPPAAAVNAPAGDAPLPVPGVRSRWSGDKLTIEWRLSPQTQSPGLEVLLVKRGPSGVETETRTIDLDRDTGRIILNVSGLHLARAAAGFRSGGNFVPVARE
jgi:hypothetical protein